MTINTNVGYYAPADTTVVPWTDPYPDWYPPYPDYPTYPTDSGSSLTFCIPSYVPPVPTGASYKKRELPVVEVAMQGYTQALIFKKVKNFSWGENFIKIEYTFSKRIHTVKIPVNLVIAVNEVE